MKVSTILCCAGVFSAALLLGCGKQCESTCALQPVVAGETQLQEAPRASADADKKEAPSAAPVSFAFSDDDAGKLLSKILPPKPSPSIDPPSQKAQSERILPPSLAQPEVPSINMPSNPARYPLPGRKDAKPIPLMDRVPLDLSFSEIDRPERIEMPVGALAKLETPDVKQPAALPVLARPTPDRASLEDPTAEFTSESILNGNLPLRSTQASFVKVTLPEPFENVADAKVKIEVKEDPLTALGNPPAPKP